VETITPSARSSRAMWLVRNHQMDNAEQQPFLIRVAGLEDVKGILDCLDAAFAEFRGDYTAEAFAETVPGAGAIQDRMAAMQLFVAVSMGDIVGTIGCEAKGADGQLRGMAVLPNWQGTGVASALLQAAEGDLQRRACQRVVLGTTEPLKRAIRFYQRRGFVPSGHVAEFFGMQLHVFAKPL
jgi:GNAT superfamily N-acetyltransferase